MTSTRVSLLGAVVLLAALASGCIVEASDSSLTIVNGSDFVIDEIRVAEISDPSYGPNLVGSEALFPDEEITVFLECGTYDVLIVDELGASCELLGFDLCFDDEVWVVDNFQLATCSF